MSGNGSISVLPTAEEHNRTRRAAKVRGRRNGSGISVSQDDILLDGAHDHRSEQRNGDRRIASARQTATQLAFRQRQAKLAVANLDSQLTGIARKVAELVIEYFPDADTTTGLSRTKAAEARMRKSLTDQELKNTNGVDLGIRRARSALTEAYNALNGGANRN